jgi:hypothetical protein
MLDQRRQRHPIVAIQPRTADRTGGRIVMHSSPFHAFAEALCRRIVQSQQPSRQNARIKLLQYLPQDHCRKDGRVPSEIGQGIVETVPIILNARAGKPGGGHAAIVRQHHSGHHDRQAKRNACIEQSGHLTHHAGERSDQRNLSHSGLLAVPIVPTQPRALVELRRATMFFVFGLWTIRRLVKLSHPWFLSCCSEDFATSTTWIRTTVFSNTTSALRPLKNIRRSPKVQLRKGGIVKQLSSMARSLLCP